MQDPQNIIDCYDRTAAAYAASYDNELEHKPLDRALLRAFADEQKDKGPVIDLGCGPGQTTRFLYEAGITAITGTDISPGIISQARQINPLIHFEVADMLALPYADNHFGGALAFYSIVHFTTDQVKTVFREIHRVLKPGGQFLFSFHLGDEIIHRTEFLGATVDIQFYFFQTTTIRQLLAETAFVLKDCTERLPYPEVEYASKRVYILAEK